MKIKHTTLAAAVSAAVLLGASGQAAAYIYAGSSLEVSGLTINITPASLSIPTTYTFTSDNNATLNGSTDTPSAQVECAGTAGQPGGTCGGSPVLSAAVANSPSNSAGYVRADNSYTFFSYTDSAQYANSESAIITAQLASGGGVPTSTNSISEVNITGSGSAQANTTVTSSTLLNFFFTLDALGSLELDFNADRDLYAAINSLANVTLADASAGTTANFTLTYLGANSVPAPDGAITGSKLVWSPDGTLTGCNTKDAGLVGVLCATEIDPESLNSSVNPLADIFGGNPSEDGRSDSRQGTLGGTPSPDLGLRAYGITIQNLFAGRWSLRLDTTTTANVIARVAQVPEPGTLALLGVGLMGLGRVARRHKKARLS